MSLCSSFSSSWVPGSVSEEVYRLINLDLCPPGVFNFGREVYKCNSRFNFLRVTSEGQRMKDFHVSSGGAEVGRTWPWSCLGAVPVQHIPPQRSTQAWSRAHLPLSGVLTNQCFSRAHRRPGSGQRLGRRQLTIGSSPSDLKGLPQ